MAKKQNFSHIGAQEALESATSSLTADNLPYVLLSTFCGYGDASIERVKDGRDNKSREPGITLIKDKFVYRPYSPGSEPLDVIISLKNNAAITRHNPRLYITCDGANIVAYDPKDDDTYDGPLKTLWKDFEFFKPLAGIEKFRNYEEAEADVKTAELMAKIYDDICRYNDFRDKEVSHHINVFMSRLLFCFFAEDTGLFKQNQFTQAIESNTNADGSDLADFIDRLFVIMSTDDKGLREQQTNKVISDFPYVNGGLFLQRYPIPKLSRRTRALMIKCGKYQWRDINPDIFGSMTQAIVSPEERSELGIHYTSVPNIMKVIQPLFLDDLAAEFLRCRNNAKDLNALLVRMSKIKFFDPACGSGNFLIITYKRVRELEIEIWKRLRELKDPRIPFSEIALTQFYGIELDEYACDTATLSLWLAEHQMNNKFRDEFGTSPNPLPLRPSGHIVCGNACTSDWNTVCPHTADEEVYVMGNPPYLGSRNQEERHKADLDAAISDLHNYRKLDYIAIWFYKGAQYILHHSKAKCAFVSTNSICQGEQVSYLWKDIFNLGIEIQYAYTSFKWSNNAKNNAQVVVVIVGMANKNNQCKWLFRGSEITRCEHINAYLSPGSDVFISGQSSPITKTLPPMIYGSEPRDGGGLMLTPEQKNELLSEGECFNRFIKRAIGSDEYLSDIERYCLLIDDDELEFAKTSTFISQRLKSVESYRLSSKRADTVKYSSRPFRFTNCTYRNSKALIIPIISSERRRYIPVGYLDHDAVILNSAFAVYECEYWQLGVLLSYIHNVWVKALCGRMKTDLRYSNTLLYNTFPFPTISKSNQDEIENKAKEILLTRAGHTELTIGEMYSPENFPEDLRAAHHSLDLAVERCYREKPFESDEERLEFLFKQYVKLTTDKSTLWKI